MSECLHQFQPTPTKWLRREVRRGADRGEGHTALENLDVECEMLSGTRTPWDGIDRAGCVG